MSCTGDLLSVGAACARFLSEWRGTDPADGARELLALLPPRIPGALRLVIARALRDLDVPAFASADEFRSAVARFAERPVVETQRKQRREEGARRRSGHVASGLLLAAAAVAIFALGVLAGQLVDFREFADLSWVMADPAAPQPDSPPAAAIATPDPAPRAIPPPAERATATAGPSSDRRPAAAALRKIGKGDRATFSPSFSTAGSAVFYHRDDGVGSALVKAETDSQTGDLRVIKLVDDGARNYHVRPSPDGTRIAFDSDRDGERGVYIADADGANVRRVSGPGFAAVPTWSPDGTQLSFVRGEPHSRGRVWNLWLLDLPSGALVRLTSYRFGQPWGASWFPDGRRLAYSHEDRLVVLDLQTGARRVFPSPRNGRLVRTPAVSPDGRHVVFQALGDGAWMLDVNDGSMRRILDDATAEEFAWDRTGRRLAFHSRRSGSWSVWVMAADR